MAPLIWPSIARMTVNGTYGGRAVANIFDYRVDSPEVGITREEGLQILADDIVNSWCDRVLPLVANDYTFTSVTWVDLDSETGSTGISVAGADETLPQNGESTEDPIPPNVAALVTKVAPGGGRATRNGRTYLVGLRETQTDPGNPTRLTSAAQGFISAALDGFSADTSNADLEEGWATQMVVLRTRNIADPGDPPNVVAVGANDVTQMVCDITLATQRRRLRGR